MTVNGTANIVPAPEVNLVLYIKVHNTCNTVGAQEAVDGVDHGIELRDHRKSIAHSDKFSSTRIGVLIQIADGLTLDLVLLSLVGLCFVLMETEGACVLTDDFDIGPAEASEAFASHLTQTWREVDDV